MSETFTGVVAIDGPSGSGKSTVAKAVATRLGLRYLDTGAMYRAVCAAAMYDGIDLHDEAATAAYAQQLELFTPTDPADQTVIANGRDVTAEIRTTRVSENVSAVATNLAVRAELIARQQAIVAGGAIVLEGRDTTTVVAPYADVRLLITADPEARIARRTAELHDTVDQETLTMTTAQIVVRDEKDSTVVDFQSASDGVHEIDTTNLTLEQTIDTALHLVWHAPTSKQQQQRGN
ncbi:cytidylate kinase [Antricoccus suffuscus]|uniref:Cytidylate kinase n=1 Tax=Antricoccus suffuscus TaxID=1629062 RepID=A0A2T0ZX33_9ACTN|nr:(d)CMP kinase [Antricoccus suffuscus]PRZ40925.1 cytidylate kinase [Antricoccus suffuscus]